jgi:hypothetical protein
MTNTYTLTGTRIDGHLELTFTDAILNRIEIAVNKPLNEKQFRALVEGVPMHEQDLPQLQRLGLSWSLLLPTHDKIALWCRLYKEYKGIAYNVSAADAGKIARIKVSEDTLRHYFTSANFLFKDKHSISNLVKYFNELLAEIAAPKLVKSKHPDHYSKQYEDRLDANGLTDYRNHLRSLGLVPQLDKFYNIKDWYKPDKAAE